MEVRRITRADAIQTKAVDVAVEPAFKTTDPEDARFKSLFSVCTGSTYRTNNPSFQRKKETADVFHGAINTYGLPMAVVLDGCGRYAENSDIQKLARHIMSMLENLTHLLQSQKFSTIDINYIIKEKYQQLDSFLQHKVGSEASFAAVVIYQDVNGQLKSVSFGTGDTLVAMDDGEIVSTVIAARNVQESDDFFPPLSFPRQKNCNMPINRILENLEIDIRVIKEGDRFLFLTDGLHEHLSTTIETLEDSHRKLIVRKCLDSKKIASGKEIVSLMQMASDADENNFFAVDSRKETITLGDDATVGEMKIPSAKKQQTLLCAICEIQLPSDDQALAAKSARDKGKEKENEQELEQVEWISQKKLIAEVKRLRKQEIVDYVEKNIVRNEEKFILFLNDYHISDKQAALKDLAWVDPTDRVFMVLKRQCVAYNISLRLSVMAAKLCTTLYNYIKERKSRLENILPNLFRRDNAALTIEKYNLAEAIKTELETSLAKFNACLAFSPEESHRFFAQQLEEIVNKAILLNREHEQFHWKKYLVTSSKLDSILQDAHVDVCQFQVRVNSATTTMTLR